MRANASSPASYGCDAVWVDTDRFDVTGSSSHGEIG